MTSQQSDAAEAPNDPAGRQKVGVVLVGRNESARLPRSVSAAREQAAVVIYVDSNSTDGSRELAAEHGAEVIHLTEGPYTPARGRQVGFNELSRRHPELPYVHFVDGDCVLQPGWVAKAYRHLEANPKVGAVFGRRREERCAESFYSRLMDVDWDAPSGAAANFGGDLLARVDAVRAAGSWSPTTINAEDIDLSFRMRADGWTIFHLAEEMTSHDVRMTRFAEYWKRSVRAGYGYAEVGWRYRKGPGWLLLRRMLSTVFYVVLLPLLALILAFVWWPGALLVALLYVRMLLVLALSARRRGSSWRMAFSYAGLNLVCKVAALLGSLRYWRDRLIRKDRPSDHLIVYRTEGSKVGAD